MTKLYCNTYSRMPKGAIDGSELVRKFEMDEKEEIPIGDTHCIYVGTISYQSAKTIKRWQHL